VKPVSTRIADARSLVAAYPRTFWVLVAGDTIQALAFGLIVPYMALYLTDTVGATPGRAGLALAVWSAAALVGQPAGGLLADRVGRRPVILAGLAGSAAATLAFATVHSIWAAAAISVPWGLMNSLFEPAAAALVGDVVSEERRTEAFGIWRVANNALFAVGPPLGALLVWLASLRAIFVVAGLALAGYLLFAWRAIPETRPAPAEHEPPARFRETLRDRSLVVLCLGTAVVAMLFALYETVLPVFLKQDRGFSLAAWGLIFGINPILVTCFQFPLARRAARRSSRAVLAAASLVTGAALAIISPFAALPVLVLAVVALTFGEMLHAPVSTAAAVDLAPARLRGSYQGALHLGWEGPWGPTEALGLWIVGLGHGRALFAAALPIGILGALLFLVLPGGSLRRDRKSVV